MGEKYDKFINGEWDKHIESDEPSSLKPVATADDVLCGNCHQPAKAEDIHYPWGEVEFSGYYLCQNPACPRFGSVIPIIPKLKEGRKPVDR